MANHKSAMKRARQSKRRAVRNDLITSAMKTAVRKSLEAIEKAADKKSAAAAMKGAENALRKAASKGAIPAERASRKISRIAAKINAKFA